ncbi:MAG TPA: tRNA lysidine(34) synthetase TilS [Thermoanaerobaculia bacterium]|nr:tRNA lysidine(34) synthetase TilS [Thermoanaerobaculia bacterium]
MDLPDALARAARTGLLPPRGTVLLAVSGGADSLALLHAAALSALSFGWRLAVGHVHHGWRGREADRDLAFVRDHARRLELPFLARFGDAHEESSRCGLSPEAGARRLRYAGLLEMAREAGAPRIATAHQREDVVESFLLARERHGGIAGLAGPRVRRADGVVRPLLQVSRAEIRRFLESRGLFFRRDRSNGDLSLARNRIRRTIAAAPAALREEWEKEARRWSDLRDGLDRDLEEKTSGAIRWSSDSVLADAEELSGWPAELQRQAVQSAAAPFARSGRPPMTGREREEILRRLARGADFRFEAGRRIRIERRGRILAFTLRPAPGAAQTVYDPERLPAGSILHGESAPRVALRAGTDRRPGAGGCGTPRP